MAGNSSNSSTSTGSAAGAAGAGVGAGVGSETGATGAGVGAGVGSETGATGSGNNSTNGGSKGGLPGLTGESWDSYTSKSKSETEAAHAAGVQGPGTKSGNFGSKWGGSGKYSVRANAEGKHNLSPNAEGKYTLTLDGGDGKGNYSLNNTKYMTVDDVYGKSDSANVAISEGTAGTQSIVENQGDYEAVSNEKSNVETQTFGKQDEIAVTPVSITENKGEVENDAIQSVEGLDFQQKDKVAQEVMEAKKSRDEAEAEDKSDKAQQQLAANEAEENDEITFNFKVGEKNDFEEQNNARLNELNQKKQELENAKNEEKDAIVAAEKAEAEAKEADKAVEEALSLENRVKQLAARFAEKEKEGRLAKDDSFLEGLKKAAKTIVSPFTNDSELQGLEEETISLAKELGTNDADTLEGKTVGDFVPGGKEGLLSKAQENLAKNAADRVAVAKDNQRKAQEVAKTARTRATELTAKAQEAQANYDKADKTYNTWKTEYWTNAEKAKAKEEEEAVSAKSNAEVSFEATREAINNADIAEETKSKAIETINNVEAVTKSVNDAADVLAANPNDPAAIEAYVNAVKTYNENLENALKGNPLAKTDLNKTFTEMVAKANDFDVTMPDGTKKSYAEFAAEKAVESPALAKGLYEAKAARLAEEGHTVLAAIETAKSKMVTTWLGSKFTFADNQVRNQFNQMAKTDMRATYATYNNVLNDPNATPEQRADAEAQISQAKSLMTASAALQASTGFFSGIGDSVKDGVYGVTNPGDLKGYQKTMNTVSNFAKVVLGLGVTPGANKAYQNMYYLAGDKVNKSNLFNKDFDGDGFALCQEYGNNATAGMIAGVGELATGIALFFNPATASMGLNLAMDSIQTFLDGLYGVQREAKNSVKYSSEIVGYLNEAKEIVKDANNPENDPTVSTTGVTIDRVIDSAISQIENFELKSDEANNLDNWLEGSGSNTAANEKFNQSLTYDEWLKLIEADPTMQEYAKKLIAEKK